MGRQDWTVISAEEVYRNDKGLIVNREKVLLPDGRTIPHFYQVQMPSHVTVYAMTRDGMVACLRQYKHGPRKVSLTLPGGLIDAGEDPAEAAKRELLEETGLSSNEWVRLGSFTLGGNQGIATAHLFSAAYAEEVRAPNSGDLEEMALEFLSPERVLAEVRSGNFPIIGHVAAIALANLKDQARS